MFDITFPFLIILLIDTIKDLYSNFHIIPTNNFNNLCFGFLALFLLNVVIVVKMVYQNDVVRMAQCLPTLGTLDRFVLADTSVHVIFQALDAIEMTT